MKLRWIFLVALVHFLITECALFFALPWLFPFHGSGTSPDFWRNIHGREIGAAILTFPVGLLEWATPIIPMLVNSLLWGWVIMALVTWIRKHRAPTVVADPADVTAMGRRSFLICTLLLALFSFALTPVAAGSSLTVFVLLLIALITTQSITLKQARKNGWTRRKTLSRIYRCMAAFLAVFVILTLVPWPCMSVTRNENISFTETVTRLRSMQNRWIPSHLMMIGGIRSRTNFNVNQYFTVLNRLAPQPGWTLDYVYAYDPLRGYPILYAKRKWAIPFLSYAAYLNSCPEPESKDQPAFLQHIKTDGTPEGFVQLAVLHIIANQFYLFWHANYNDTRIVHDRGQLDTLLAKQDILQQPTAEERQKAASLDLQPLVELRSDTASVSLLTWTDRGGLYRKTFTIRREFPHRIEKIVEEQIASHFCGITF